MIPKKWTRKIIVDYSRLIFTYIIKYIFNSFSIVLYNTFLHYCTIIILFNFVVLCFELRKIIIGNGFYLSTLEKMCITKHKIKI